MHFKSHEYLWDGCKIRFQTHSRDGGSRFFWEVAEATINPQKEDRSCPLSVTHSLQFPAVGLLCHSTGCLTVSVLTLIAYFSAIPEYYRISSWPLNRLGGGFCLRYETPWYMQGCLRKMQNAFLADFQVLWFFALFWTCASSLWPPMARYQLTWWSVINYSTIEIKFLISLHYSLSRVAKIDLKFPKLGKKAKKIENEPKKYLVIFLGILACTKLFYTLNKIPHLDN